VAGELEKHVLEGRYLGAEPTDANAFAPLAADEPTGPGLAVIAPDLPPAELPLISACAREAGVIFRQG